MAEGWARFLKGDIFDVYSAGIETHGLNPNAIKVMQECGVDISNHKSTNINEYVGQEFDYVITVCDHAHQNCPWFPAKTKLIHKSFDDPPKLAENAKTEEETLYHYRRVRDEIKAFIILLPECL